MNSNRITFSIVSHGHADMVTVLLSQLDNNVSLRGSHVIVTNNCLEIFEIQSYSNIYVTFVNNKYPLGFGKNHNNAFKFCDTSWFIVLNPDLRIIKDEPFTSAIDSIGATIGLVGVIGPTVVNEFGVIEDSVRSNLTPLSLLRRFMFGRVPELSLGNHSSSQTFFWFGGMCMLFNSSAFSKVGGFDERFFLYCEDYDICARLHDSGYILRFVPEAIVEHSAQRDSHKSMQYLFWHLKSLFRVWTSAIFWKITLFR